MFKLFVKVVLVFLFTVSLQAKNGLTQKHLLSLSTDDAIELTFDLPIVKKSIKNHTINLKNLDTGKKVKGKTSLKNISSLLFTPHKTLLEGKYRLRVKSLKLQDDLEYKNNSIKKYLHKLCLFFYDDIRDCPLYRFISSSVKTKMIKYTFSIEGGKVKVIDIILSKSIIELEEGNQTSITVTANYDDNSTKDVTQDVQWIIGDSSVITIDTNSISALAEGHTSLQAMYEAKKSVEIKVNVYKEVNGHRLPPEPDKTLNDSTLLGIDSNDNGVRDDVEIWIYETYKDKHPIHIDIAMQAGRAYKLVLKTPEKALEIHDEVNKAVYCQGYYKYSAKHYNEPILIQKNAIDEYFRSAIYFNTQERMDTYIEYDTLLSGGVYTLPKDKEKKAACDFNTNQYEK